MFIEDLKDTLLRERKNTLQNCKAKIPEQGYFCHVRCTCVFMVTHPAQTSLMPIESDGKTRNSKTSIAIRLFHVLAPKL